jgi:hypothetical protein
MDRKATVAPFVISAEFEDSIVVVNLNSKRYYILNDTAGYIWRGITQGKAESEIVELMFLEYDATKDRIAASVSRLFEAFKGAELIA